MTTRATLVLALVFASPVMADDYPTKPDERDKLCEVIGEAPNISVPPRDRLWFKENCVCGGKGLGCGNPRSHRWALRMAKNEKEVRASIRAAEERRRAATAAALEQQRLAEEEQRLADEARAKNLAEWKAAEPALRQELVDDCKMKAPDNCFSTCMDVYAARSAKASGSVPTTLEYCDRLYAELYGHPLGRK
jgi:hypothetical protein